MRALVPLLSLLGLVLACAPAAAPTPTPTPAAAPVPALESVKIIHVPSVLFAPLYVAMARGYFRQQGIDVQLERAAAGQDAMPVLANSQIDALVGGFAAATFNAAARGLNVRIVASMGRQPHQGYPSALMVRKDLLESGAVSQLADLRGRKVALSGGLGATGSYWMATKLRQAGLGLRDIEVVNMGFPDMVAAFKSRAVDAAFPSAPATTQIRNDGTADYFGGVTQPGASAVGVTFSGAFITNRRQVALRVLMALVQGARDVQGDAYFAPDNLQAYATYTDTPVETLKRMDPYEFDPDLGLDLQTLQDMQQVFITLGVEQAQSPIPTSSYADDSLLKAAAQQAEPAAAR
jgi:NitT/TauT family transport system substrate-binding protein